VFLAQVEEEDGNIEATLDWFKLAVRTGGLARGLGWWPYHGCATAALWFGRLSDTLAACESARVRALRIGIPLPPHLLQVYAEALAWKGELELAAQALEARGVDDEEVGQTYVARMSCAGAFVRELSGDNPGASELFGRALTGLSTDSYVAGVAAAGLARTLALQGDVAGSSRACQAILPLHKARRAEAEFYVDLARGLPASKLRESYTKLEATGVGVLLRARALLYLGRARGDRDALMSAAKIFASSGARSLLEMARAIARERGIRMGRRSVTQGSLTPREAEVVGLVAEGKTNFEIASVLHITPRTVAANISSVLAKCEMTSRVDIAARVVSGAPFERVIR
jgi:DNA-binding CsgD family transcriptional regulator